MGRSYPCQSRRLAKYYDIVLYQRELAKIGFLRYISYPPLSDTPYHMGAAVDLGILSLHIAGVSSLMGKFDCPTWLISCRT
jgi:heme/copper-type cytochrome/quinol oxidase subunit 1